jgi:hypothetical protein
MSNDDVRILGQKIQLNEDVDGLVSQKYFSEYTPTEQSALYAGKVCYHQNRAHIQDIAKAISLIDSDRDILEYYVDKGCMMDRLSAEGLMISTSLRKIFHLEPYDTRDENGAQRHHHFSVHTRDLTCASIHICS